jgi:uncharacterized protein (TIGR02444 family)
MHPRARASKSAACAAAGARPRLDGAMTSPAALLPDNAFWRFSLAVYAAPGAQAACLALQDRFGVDVNLALFCAWAGAARGRALAPPELAAAAAEVAAWRDGAVVPLRAVRRAVKTMPDAAGDPSVDAFRRRVAALELEAEQLEQARLFRWAEARWPPDAATAAQPDGAGLARANLAAFLGWHGGAVQADAEATAAADLLAEAAWRRRGCGGAT